MTVKKALEIADESVRRKIPGQAAEIIATLAAEVRRLSSLPEKTDAK